MIAVVSHDAGGAEVISSWLANQRIDCDLVLGGPARGIFARKLNVAGGPSLDEAISRAEWVLCGTSWSSDLEWRAIGMARDRGKRSVAYLDHWENYRQRFARDGVLRLPDEIWVGDADAESVARESFPTIPITLVPNAYFADFAREVAELDSVTPPSSHEDAPVAINVLYLGENQSTHGDLTYGDPAHFGYTEIDTLIYLITHLYSLDRAVRAIRIRAHPSETPDKYLEAISTLGVPTPAVEVSEGTLAQDVAWSDVVAGGTSMALALAATAGRLAVSCIPDPSIGIALPGSMVARLNEFEPR